ncbi:MAG TPA: NAD(P)-dependent oxidoreductase [Thermomicrobiales bacterium]|nr:NAD(P)-dependent oxidoreductase [Thermomicrobiales bacterium]
MTSERVKIIVWDSIGNTLLGVRPWTSWDAPVRETLLQENPDAETIALPLREILAGYDVDLTWFNSADVPYAPFGQLYADYEGSLRFTRSVDEIMGVIEDADFLVVHKERLPAEALERAKKLRLVQHLGQDYRGVPLDAARARGVPVAATPLINYITVAEQVWAYILNWTKRLPSLRTHMTSRAYVDSWHSFPDTKYLGDLTLGLLGMGEIARPVARAAHAFGMPVRYWDIERFPELETAYSMRFTEWEELFATADVLSVQLALKPETEGIIGARELGLMKPTALFINTARGKLVDQAALTDALVARRIGAVALDVFAEEPLPVDDPLLTLHDRAEAGERVTLTPHNAWQSPWTWVRDSQELWRNVRRSLRGEPIHHLV